MFIVPIGPHTPKPTAGGNHNAFRTNEGIVVTLKTGSIAAEQVNKIVHC